MWISDFSTDTVAAFLIFSIPIIAIVGGITAGIVRIVSRHRLIELAQRERIAAIERGVDPAKLTPLQNIDDLGGVYLPPGEHSRRLSQRLMIGGLVTLCVGVSLCIFLSQVAAEDHAWTVGLIPASAGAALLLSAWIIRPRNGAGSGPGRQV